MITTSTAWKVCWRAVSLLVISALCQAQSQPQPIGGCDCTYIEQPVGDLGCDPYLSGVSIKCTVIGLQGCSIEYYRSSNYGGNEIFRGDIHVTTLENVIIQGRSYKRHSATLTIDESSLTAGQQYWCHARGGGKFLKQSNTLLIEPRNYYTSRNYTSCRSLQSATFARCADLDIRLPAEHPHVLAILLPIWLCVLACTLLLIFIVAIDRKIKKNGSAAVTRCTLFRAGCETPEIELTRVRDTSLLSTKQGLSGASNYPSSDTECVDMLYSPILPITDEDYQKIDPDSMNYTSMYSKPRPPGKELVKESEYELIDTSTGNSHAITNPPVRETEEEEEGIYQLIDSSRQDPEYSYAMSIPPKKDSKSVYQVLDSSKLNPENPYANRNPLAKATKEGV